MSILIESNKKTYILYSKTCAKRLDLTVEQRKREKDIKYKGSIKANLE